MDFAPLKIKIETKDVKVAAELLKKLGVTAQDTSRSIDRFNNKTERTSKAMKTFQRSFGKFAGSLSTFSNQLNTYVALPLIAAGGAAIKFSNDLNRGLANVSTLIPGQTQELQRYKEEIKSLSVETGKSFDDLTRGLYEVISAFPGTREAIEITELAAKSARAGLSTTKQALDLLSATTKAYGDTSADAQKKVADLAFSAVKYGQTTFLDVASAIQTVTERSQALGITQEELFATFATFTGVTGDAAMVSTQLRSALISLTNPTRELEQLYAEINVSSGKEFIQTMGGMQEALKFINDYAERNNMSIQNFIRRIEGITLTGSIATNMADTFAEKLDLLGDSAGATQEAFKEATDGIYGDGFRMEQALRRMQVAGTEIGDVLVPMFADLVENVSNFALSIVQDGDTVNVFLVELGKNLLFLIGLTKGISILSTSLVTLQGVLKSIGIIISTGALGALAGVGLGLGAGFIAFSKAVDDADKELSNADRTLKEFITSLDRMGAAQRDFDTIINLVADLSDQFDISKDNVVDILLKSTDISAEVKDQLREIKSINEMEDMRIKFLEDQKKLIDEQTKALYDQEVLRWKWAGSIPNQAPVAPKTQLTGPERWRKLIEDDTDALFATLRHTDTIRSAFANDDEFYQKKIDITQQYIDEYMEVIERERDLTEEEQKIITDYLDFLRGKQDVYAGFLSNGGSPITPPKENTDAWSEALKEYEKTIDIIGRMQIDGIIGQPEAIDRVEGALQKLANTGYDLGVSAEQMKPFIDYLRGLMEVQPGIIKLSESMEDMLSRVKVGAIKSSAAMGLYAGETEIYRVQMEGLAKMIQDGLDSGKTLNELDHITKKMVETREAFVWSGVKDQILDIFGSQLPSAFNEIGRALANSTNAMEGFKDALANTMLTVAEAIPGLMIQAGLQMLIESGGKRGWGLLSAGIAGEIGVGWARQDRENRQESNARGGVYGYADGGAFTNSIVNSPTQFAFANGVGLMGEAGPEAIMPLSRTQDGRLGVAASGGSDKDVIINIVNQANNSEVETRERETSTGKEIDVIIKSKISQVIASGGADGPMRSRYGVSPKGFR